jgi:hypothetical protein
MYKQAIAIKFPKINTLHQLGEIRKHSYFLVKHYHDNKTTLRATHT